jgi:hypothetical protein
LPKWNFQFCNNAPLDRALQWYRDEVVQLLRAHGEVEWRMIQIMRLHQENHFEMVPSDSKGGNVT